VIKRIKHFQPDALIKTENFRRFVEKFESEILRGISSLSILTIIKRHGDKGIYGYKLLQELTEETENMLILEEGTLYPILRKLEKDGIVTKSEKKSESGRNRNYYSMTDDGIDIFNHISGFFTKLMEAIGPILDLSIEFNGEKYIFCPNCSNKIEIVNEDLRFCRVCGFNVRDDIQEKRGGNQQ
jgi:DNA-binding PadR family transcriptional regulator